MPATQTRVACPYCGRVVALNRQGAINRHGPTKFRWTPEMTEQNTAHMRRQLNGGRYVPETHTPLYKHSRPGCAGTGLAPLSGDLTEKQIAFLNHCHATGDALPVARFMGVTYTAPDIAEAVGIDRVDEVVAFLIDHARDFIVKAVRDYRSGVMV